MPEVIWFPRFGSPGLCPWIVLVPNFHRWHQLCLLYLMLLAPYHSSSQMISNSSPPSLRWARPFETTGFRCATQCHAIRCVHARECGGIPVILVDSESCDISIIKLFFLRASILQNVFIHDITTCHSSPQRLRKTCLVYCSTETLQISSCRVKWWAFRTNSRILSPCSHVERKKLNCECFEKENTFGAPNSWGSRFTLPHPHTPRLIFRRKKSCKKSFEKAPNRYPQRKK